MENGGGSKRWGFGRNEEILRASAFSIRGILGSVIHNLNPDDTRPVIPLGHGDPSAFPCFRTPSEAQTAISDAVYSAKFNCYAPTIGLLPARQ
nr:tyrosine aminotransferase-like [Ipomoea batatas]